MPAINKLRCETWGYLLKFKTWMWDNRWWIPSLQDNINGLEDSLYIMCQEYVIKTFCKVYVELGSMGEYYNKCNSDFTKKVNEIYNGPDYQI